MVDQELKLQAFAFAQADDDFYAPLSDVSRRGTEYRPSRIADGWRDSHRDIWTVWSDVDGPGLADAGWKIHVSAQLARAPAVLDVVADACFAAGVPFKHVGCSRFFLMMHHKHAPRTQSGKFCALYPPDELTARRLMESLADTLAAEDGPYVLTDRRFRDSRVVHYRFGAFVARSRVRPDGETEYVVLDGLGNEVPDRREPAFVL